MIKRDELTGPSCLTNAADDEPLFVLRANDEQAPGIVRAWAYAYRSDKQQRGKYFDAAIRKFEEAIALAGQMERWKSAQVPK